MMTYFRSCAYCGNDDDEMDRAFKCGDCGERYCEQCRPLDSTCPSCYDENDNGSYDGLPSHQEMIGRIGKSPRDE